jgi:hypothetical protein
MDNHFSLIMGTPEKVKTPEELKIANNELILFRGWWLVDTITVLAHFLTTIILIVPLFGFTLLERVMYSQFSLIPRQYLITMEDVYPNFWSLPMKLYIESEWIKCILVVIMIYWGYSIIDLVYYYISMEFPQENFFKKVQPQKATTMQKIFRRTMWTLVIISVY